MAFKNPFHLLPGSVTAAILADGAVTAAKLAAAAVTSGAIAANAVLTAALADAAVTTVKITDNAITAGKIQADAVTATAIQANAIIASKIAAGAVTATALAANSVTAGSIVAGALDAFTITGATIQTAAAGVARWVLSSAGGPETLTAFSGLAAEVTPASIMVSNFASRVSSMLLTSADMQNGLPAGGSTGTASIELVAQGVGVAPGGFAGINLRTGTRGGVSINGTDAIRQIGIGTWSGTTDVSGQIAGISHRCTSPDVIMVNQTGGPGSGRVRVSAIGINLFTIQINNTTTGAAFAAGSVFSGTFIAMGK